MFSSVGGESKLPSLLLVVHCSAVQAMSAAPIQHATEHAQAQYLQREPDSSAGLLRHYTPASGNTSASMSRLQKELAQTKQHVVDLVKEQVCVVCG